MNDQLRELLERRADHVRNADLAHGAMRSGRRRRHLRTGAVGVTTMAVVAAMAGGYLALQPAGAEDGAAERALDYPWLPGTMWYLASDGAGMAIFADTGGDVTRTDAPPYLGGTPSVESWEWVLSPDGTHLAAVTDDGLRLGEITSNKASLVYESDSLCITNVWSPDASQLLVGECADDEVTLIIFDVDSMRVVQRISDPPGLSAEVTYYSYPETAEFDDPTGSVAPYEPQALWTADGGQLVWGNFHTGYTIADSDGSNQRPLQLSAARTIEQHKRDLGPYNPRDGEEASLTVSIADVSADGRYVCQNVSVDNPPSDSSFTATPPAWGTTECELVEDTATGEFVDAAIPSQYLGDEMPSAWDGVIFDMAPDGSVLVVPSIEGDAPGFHAVVARPDGTVVGSRPLPEGNQLPEQLWYAD